MRGPKQSILESMSCIYEVLLKHKVSDDLRHQLIRAYSYLQNSRDDTVFADIARDLNEEFFGSLQSARVNELTHKPFNLGIKEALEHDEMTQLELSKKWRQGFNEYFNESGDISKIQ